MNIQEYEKLVDGFYKEGYKLAARQDYIPPGSILRVVKKPINKIDSRFYMHSLELEWSLIEKNHDGVCVDFDKFIDFFVLGKSLYAIDDWDYYLAKNRIAFRVLHEGRIGYISKQLLFCENNRTINFLVFYKTP